MKAGKAHRVPLVPEMMELLKTVPRRRGCDFVFYGQKAKPLSNMAMLMLLRRMGLGQYTVHGFRSTFRDWVAEQTSFAGELAEMALAHTVQNKVEAAYRRGDMFARRRTLMEHWAGYVTGRPVGLELQADDLKKRLTPAELAALAAMLQVDGAL
jgi:integrase